MLSIKNYKAYIDMGKEFLEKISTIDFVICTTD